MKSNLMNRPVLVLNGDYQPLSYYPLSLNSMKKVMKSLLKGHINVVKEYDESIYIHNQEIKLPKIVVLKKYINIYKTPKFSRHNVYLRDNYTCQYCGQKFTSDELTFDHLLPKCMGGQTTWTNIVTACKHCNHDKGGKSLEESHMHLLHEPYIPTNKQLEENSKKNYKKKENDWYSNVYWNNELKEINY